MERLFYMAVIIVAFALFGFSLVKFIEYCRCQTCRVEVLINPRKLPTGEF